MLKQKYGDPTATYGNSSSRVEAVYEFSTGARITVSRNHYGSDSTCNVLVSFVPAPAGEGLTSF